MGKNQFNIDTMFDKYLSLVKLDKRRVSPVQLRETRRAFYGAMGIMLVLLRDELTKYPDEKGAEILEDMLQQVSKFWNTEIAPGAFNMN